MLRKISKDVRALTTSYFKLNSQVSSYERILKRHKTTGCQYQRNFIGTACVSIHLQLYIYQTLRLKWLVRFCALGFCIVGDFRISSAFSDVDVVLTFAILPGFATHLPHVFGQLRLLCCYYFYNTKAWTL